MANSSNNRGLSCTAYMWTHDGPRLQTDGEHAFRYEVREFGSLIGYITADRSLQHPDVKWKRTRVQNGKYEESGEEYKTVEEAFSIFLLD